MPMTYDTRLIYETSYEGRKVFHSSLAESYDRVR